MGLTKNVRSALFLPVLAVAACVPTSTMSEIPEILYAENGRTIYSSASKTVTRQMCPSGEVSLPADLPHDTLKRIANLAVKGGFFELPENIDEPTTRFVAGDDDELLEEVRVRGPCGATSLEIAFHGKRHRIFWSCSYYVSSRPETVALWEALTPFFDKMPTLIREGCIFVR